ncbi:hypothetical protein BV898_07383 [Hypsibius exemplaris]|uniref:Uncharacterized protein n=1 Tax=Hypsibius exemplaris TaxID=2072580 RepID=A0A1W0WTS8_HYPEX|nr:hypothetical protein BV898_07383 [Hypsibius exemplaris]
MFFVIVFMMSFLANLVLQTVGKEAGNRHKGPSEKIQVEIELIRLENPYGISVDGPCDPMLAGCDTRIFAYIDWENPFATWPGSRPFSAEDLIFEVEEPVPTSMDIRRIMTNHVCAAPYRGFALRVQVMDEDKLFRAPDDLINNFNCISKQKPTEWMELARWSNDTYCDAVKNQPGVSLMFRSRVFKVAGPPCSLAPDLTLTVGASP